MTRGAGGKVGGKAKSLLYLKKEGFRLWSKVVLSRDPVCVVCGKAESKQAHHLFPRSRYRHLHYDLRNGAGLCIACHYQIHYAPVVPILTIQGRIGRRMDELIEASTEKGKPYGKATMVIINSALRSLLEAE